MIYNLTSLLSLLGHILCPLLRCSQIIHGSIKQCAMTISGRLSVPVLSIMWLVSHVLTFLFMACTQAKGRVLKWGLNNEEIL